MKLLIKLSVLFFVGCLSNNEVTINSITKNENTPPLPESEQEVVTPSSNNNTVTSDSDCPSGYVFVAANNSIGTTSNFCVMKYEAKAWSDDNSNNIVES